MKEKLIIWAKRLRGLFPSKLPVGKSEFEAWADSFSVTYKLPTDHQDSIRFCLAATVMNLGPQTAYKSNQYFYQTIVAGCAKQLAGSVFYDIKQKQRAEEAAANEAKLTSLPSA